MSLRQNLVLATLAVGVSMAAGAVAGEKIFPFKVHEKTLENGLKIIAIPYDSPGIVAYTTVVRTGSREEVEEGHSGFAHFFEHMMFRGTEKYSQDAYNDELKRMGADSNGFTTDDRTQYYIVGPSAELEKMMDIESDRFINLVYNEDEFKTESLAVLGEYNKNISSPFLPMWERMREHAFAKHTYGHTTMGYLDDIKAMPDYYDYSLTFLDRFYRPENCIVVVVGDVDPEKLFEMGNSYYGAWETGYTAPMIEQEPPQEGRKEDHIDWPSPIRPYLMMGYKTAAFSDTTPDTAALDLISQLLFSESAPLYQKLVVDEQLVDFVQGFYSDHRDPYLFTVYTRVKSKELVPKVAEIIDEHIALLQGELVDQDRLDRIKSHMKYQFAGGLDSANSVSSIISGFLAMTGDAESVNRVYEQYDSLTPEDVQRIAQEVFQPERQTVITLAHTPEEEETPAPKGK